MGIIYIIVTIMVAVLIGYLFIRSARKKLAAERARKVKQAEGVFEPEENDAKAKRKKKKKRGWLHMSSLPELPETLEADIQGWLPKGVDEYLKAKQAFLQSVAAVVQAEKQFSEASRHTEYTQLPKSGSVSSSFVETFTQHQLKVMGLARSVTATRLEREKADRARAKALSKVTSFFTELAKYDTTLLDEEDERILEIARIATNEDTGSYNHNSVELPSHIYLDAEPKAPNAEAQALIEQLTEALAELVSACGDAHSADSNCNDANNNHRKASNHPKLTEPQKPVEDEVGAWVMEATAWAAALQLAHEELEQTLQPLWDSVGALEAKLERVRQLCKQLNDLIENSRRTQSERERDTRLSWAATPFDAEDKKVGVGDTRAAVGTGTNPVVLFPEGKVTETPTDHGKAKDDSGVDTLGAFRNRSLNSWQQRRDSAPRYEPVNFLTDAQQSVRMAAISLIAKATAVVEPLKKWPTPTQLFETGEVSEADNALIASIRAAVRKLGYAIAQRNAAQAKLTNAEAEAVPDAESQDSTMEETNAEAFIRNHRRHRNETERRGQLSKERNERVGAVRTQLNERMEQVTLAITAINQCTSTIPVDRTIFPKSLDAMLKVVPMVCQSTTPKTT